MTYWEKLPTISGVTIILEHKYYYCADSYFKVKWLRWKKNRQTCIHSELPWGQKAEQKHDVFTALNKISIICTFIPDFSEEWQSASHLKRHLSSCDPHSQWHFERSACRDINERGLTHEGWEWLRRQTNRDCIFTLWERAGQKSTAEAFQW